MQPPKQPRLQKGQTPPAYQYCCFHMSLSQGSIDLDPKASETTLFFFFIAAASDVSAGTALPAALLSKEHHSVCALFLWMRDPG